MGNGELVFNGHRVSVREDEKILEMDGRLHKDVTVFENTEPYT